MEQLFLASCLNFQMTILFAQLHHTSPISTHSAETVTAFGKPQNLLNSLRIPVSESTMDHWMLGIIHMRSSLAEWQKIAVLNHSITPTTV